MSRINKKSIALSVPEYKAIIDCMVEADFLFDLEDPNFDRWDSLEEYLKNTKIEIKLELYKKLCKKIDREPDDRWEKYLCKHKLMDWS